jgi:NADH-quinone oxidoreductase subunit J
MQKFIYIFLIMQILASMCVILANNTVQSILFLIIVFLVTTNIFILIGAEFLALFLLIIYVGAISV